MSEPAESVPSPTPAPDPATAAAAPAAVPAGPAITQPDLAPAGADFVREEDKPLLVLAYLPILAGLSYFVSADREYLRWHARQGLALTACYFGWTVVSTLISAAGGWLIGPRFEAFLTTLGVLGVAGLLGLSVLGIVKAFEPARWRIPVVSSLAEKF